MVMSFSLRLRCVGRKPMQEIGGENVSTGYSRNDTRDKRVGAQAWPEVANSSSAPERIS